MIYRREAVTLHSSPVLRLTLAGFSVVAIGFLVIKGKSPSVVSPIPTVKAASVFQNPFGKKSDNPDELKTKIRTQVGDTWKNYSVLVRDMSSDFKVDINGNVMFTGASVNKLPILATLYYLVSRGELDLDDVITLQKDDIQDYGTGSMRYDPPGTTYSIKTLARLMMQKSDNTAAYILANHIIGVPRIQQIVDAWGMSQTDMANNKISNADILTLMERIYREKIASHALTLEMLAFMKDTDFEDRIPGNLPKSATVYHKIGTGNGALHDAGLVTVDGRTYYIGILTNDITDEPSAIKLMSDISRTVYDFLKP